MRFKDLTVGSVFRFSSEFAPSGVGRGGYLGMAQGPWRKRSARSYEYADNPPRGHVHRVGSINAEVALDA